MNRMLGQLILAATLACTVAASSPLSAQPWPMTRRLGVSITSTVGAPENIDVLTDPDPFFVFPNQSVPFPITLRSYLVDGSMKLTVKCCFNPVDMSPVTPAGLAVFFSTPPPTAIRASESLPAGVFVSTTTAAEAGSFLFLITATAGQLQTVTEAYFRVTVVPRLTDSPANCSRFLTPTAIEVVPLAPIASQMYALKTATPKKTSFFIGAISAKNRLNGWDIAIEKASGIAPANAQLFFKNSTTWAKEVVPFNTRTCMPTSPAILRVNPGETVATSIMPGTTTTLLLRRETCYFSIFVCLNSGWEDFAVFSAPSFWPLFGGRKVTIDWIERGP